ncbi:hypothetical protein BDL97_15G066000 [Sphagnum fallax]|nr:hypothetical protein BDL97_15G066000 [Sphagnum fallax]
MAEVQQIVALLNVSPFDYSISCTEFCQKSPQQLRQVLLNVLSTIQPAKRDIDADEATTNWMIELLRVLNYRPLVDGVSFRQGIASGSCDIIYPLLTWLLLENWQMEMLKKRAYLARFLVDVEIPAELLLEEDMNMLHAQYDLLRDRFKTTHKKLVSWRQSEQEPALVKTRVEELVMERKHLNSTIAKLRTKLVGVPKVEEMVEVVGLLRGQTAEAASLTKAIQEQKKALAIHSAKQETTVSKLHQAQMLANSGPIHVVFQKIAQACALLRYLVKDRLPKEVEIKSVRLQALQDVLVHSSDSDDKLKSTQMKLLDVMEEVKKLNWKHGKDQTFNGHQGGGGGGYGVGNVVVGNEVQRQQAQMGAIVANKIQAAYDKLATLMKLRDKLVAELDQKNQAINEVKSSVRTGEDFKQYVELLRRKSSTYKARKQEMDNMTDKYTKLLHTQQLLEQQIIDSKPQCVAHSTNSNLLSGDDEMLPKLKVRRQLAELDVSLKEQGAKLGPQIKELKALRTHLQDIELEHLEKNKHYNDISGVYERKEVKLETDVMVCHRELEADSKCLQETCATIQQLETALEQLSNEKGGELSAMLNIKIQQQEELAASLQLKLHKLKETEHGNRIQMTMMKDLVTLLSAKLTMYSSSSRPAIYSTNNSALEIAPLLHIA